MLLVRGAQQPLVHWASAVHVSAQVVSVEVTTQIPPPQQVLPPAQEPPALTHAEQ